jgi:hypothetical protein
VRALAAVFLLTLSLVSTEAARADLGLTITTLRVHSGGILRGHGNATGMPVYLVPESRAPRPFRCHGGKDYCTPRSRRPPRRPYRLPGYFQRTKTPWVRQRFAFGVPHVSPGRLPGRVLVQALRANTDPGGFNAPRAGGHGPRLATPTLATAHRTLFCRPDPYTVA